MSVLIYLEPKLYKVTDPKGLTVLYRPCTMAETIELKARHRKLMGLLKKHQTAAKTGKKAHGDPDEELSSFLVGIISDHVSEIRVHGEPCTEQDDILDTCTQSPELALEVAGAIMESKVSGEDVPFSKD